MKNNDTLLCCESCKNAKPLQINDDYFCNKFGAVAASFYCKHYIKNNNLNCIQCKHFKITNSGNLTQGFCSIFTVRQFNGQNHKICSKFCRTSVLST